ncbi:MAG: HAD hydrolase family protein [Verrucomicrobiae bacterium]|nr:HAD hydrolase family protein [Verrucomicrobiae bacterium]
MLKSPRTSRTILIYALTDLDGTANDEHLAEPLRLSSIGPAREAFAVLARSGIVTGICTARSTGEALHYRRELGISGPLISENGAVLRFPDGSQRIFGDLTSLAAAAARIGARLQRPIPNSMDLPGLEGVWERERRGEAPAHLGHADIESLRRAADRSASCFLVGLSPAEKQIAAGVARELGLTCFGDLLHLIPAGIDKGRALQALNTHLLSAASDHRLRPEAVAPIVFGNGENDLPLFEQALNAGGAAVLVGDETAPGGFHFDTRRHQIPQGTLLIEGVSHGHAIQQSLPRLRDFLVERYGVSFPW